MSRTHLVRFAVPRCPKLRRGGFSWVGTVGVLSVITAVPLAGWYLLGGSSWSSSDEGPLMATIEKGTFVHDLTERGEIESSSTVDIRCMVPGGSTILTILQEGSIVKAGEVIATLDSSTLEDQRDLQQNVCSSSEAVLIQARSTFETAQTARDEYLKGTFKQDELLIQGELDVAEENLRRAEDNYKYSTKLADRGIITSDTLEADLFAVNKARKDKLIAETKLHVLREYTRKKMLTQLEADIKSAEAQLRSSETIYQNELDKLEQIKGQIELCTVRAPQDGEVTFPVGDYRDSDSTVIEEGTVVRERQIIVRLPDPTRMQVNTKINESKLRLIREGMAAQIRVEALNNGNMMGTVRRVSSYANRSRWSASSVKDFSVFVEIDNPPPGMRTGSSAEVRIRVDQSENQLLAPVQSVIEHGGKHYCLQTDPRGAWKAAEVQVGATNGEFVVIEGGLEHGHRVVMHPRTYLSQVDLPELKGREVEAEEMLAGAKTIGDLPTTPSAAKNEPPSGGRGAGAAAMFANADQDADGKLSQSEVPEPLKARFAELDKNKDGFLDRGELAAMARGPRGGGDADKAPAAGGGE